MGSEEKIETYGSVPAGPDFMAWLRQFWVILLICAAAVVLCFYAYGNATEVLDVCNNNCVEQFNEKCRTNASYEPMYNYDIEIPDFTTSIGGGE